MMKVDWPTLLAALGKVLCLTGQPDRVDALPVAVQIGWIAPAQTARFPVFFCAPTAFYPLFPSLQRFAERAAGTPFVLVVPSRDQLDTDCLGLLTSRKAKTVFLEEDVTLTSTGDMQCQQTAERLVKYALEVAGVNEPTTMPKFPTPEGATWEDFTITEIDGLTIEILAKVRTPSGIREASEQYTCERLGLSKKSKDGVKPVGAWDFLMNIVQHRRVVVPYKLTSLWSQTKKQKEQITAVLEELTSLKGAGAFTTTLGRCYYESVFKVNCELKDAPPIPDAPRRLNQKGLVAKNDADE